MLKTIAAISLFLALTSSGAYYGLIIHGQSAEEQQQKSVAAGSVVLSQQAPLSTTPTETTPQIKQLRIVATGDLILHDTVNALAKTANGYDYTKYFEGVKKYLEADLLICTQDGPSAGSSLGISGYPVFNAPSSFTEDLEAVGCNTVNLATNNVNDKAKDGILKTLSQWDKISSVKTTGANTSASEQRKINVLEIDDVTIAHLAFTENTNKPTDKPYLVNTFDEKLVTDLVKSARELADYIIVSAHWGNESEEAITPTQEKWARFLNEQGVDVVIGSGAHVIQTTEKLVSDSGKETVVYYGLGNTLGTQLSSEELVGGLAIIDITITNEKPMLNASILPTYIHYEWSAAQKAAGDYLARKNLGIYPLATSSDLIKKSQLETSMNEQLKRITKVIKSKNSGIKIVSPDEL